MIREKAQLADSTRMKMRYKRLKREQQIASKKNLQSNGEE